MNRKIVKTEVRLGTNTHVHTYDDGTTETKVVKPTPLSPEMRAWLFSNSLERKFEEIKDAWVMHILNKYNAFDTPEGEVPAQAKEMEEEIGRGVRNIGTNMIRALRQQDLWQDVTAEVKELLLSAKMGNHVFRWTEGS
jgi:hypothetical protein